LITWTIYSLPFWDIKKNISFEVKNCNCLGTCKSTIYFLYLPYV
jgi:hypothetical protein